MTRECRECGVKLPDSAQTCMQCGTPVEPPTGSVRGVQQDLKFLRPAISCGLLLGVLSSIPLINELNLFFGGWVLTGGALAAHLLRKQQPDTGISYGDGAYVGALSGLCGALISTVLLIPNKMFLVADWEEAHRHMQLSLSSAPEAKGPMADLFLRFFSPEVSATTVIFSLLLFGILYSLFAMFGGMLMVWLGSRRARRV